MLVALLTSMTISALVLMLAFPKTPTGKWLHRHLVEGPAEFLTDFTWAKLGSVAISLAVVVLLVSAGPEAFTVMTAAGIDAAMLEVMLALWLASVSGNIAGAWRNGARFAVNSLRRARSMLAPRNRTRTPRRRKYRPRRPKTDDEPGWAFA